MKKTLLYLIFPVLFAVSSVNAQIKVWDFAAEDLGAGYTNMATVTNLNAIYIGSNPAGSEFGAVTAPATSNQISGFTIGEIKTIGGGTDRIRTSNPDLTRYDGVSVPLSTPNPVYNSTATYTPTGYVGCHYFNGKGTSSKWCYILTLKAGEAVTMIVKSNGTGTPASTQGTLQVSGPSAVTIPAYAVGTVQEIHFTAGAAGDYTIYDSTSKLQVYRVYFANVVSPILANKVFQKESDVTVYTKENKIFLSNIKSSTKVTIYSVLGSLVKSIDTDTDTSLDVNSGIYIVNAKSVDGEKSIKLIVK